MHRYPIHDTAVHERSSIKHALASWFSSVPLCRLMGYIDESIFSDAHLEIVLSQKSSLASSVSHEDSALLGALDKTLVVASDAIAHRDKTELLFVKHVAVIGGKIQQIFSEAVVVLFLLERIVEGRVAKVFLSVGNKKLLEL